MSKAIEIKFDKAAFELPELPEIEATERTRRLIDAVRTSVSLVSLGASPLLKMYMVRPSPTEPYRQSAYILPAVSQKPSRSREEIERSLAELGVRRLDEHYPR